MNIAYRFRVLAAGAISLVATGAHADHDGMDTRRVRELVAQGKIVTLQALREQHATRLQGRLLDADLEKHRKRWIYELEILGNDGIVREITLDARTGEWLHEEIED